MEDDDDDQPPPESDDDEPPADSEDDEEEEFKEKEEENLAEEEDEDPPPISDDDSDDDDDEGPPIDDEDGDGGKVAASIAIEAEVDDEEDGEKGDIFIITIPKVDPVEDGTHIPLPPPSSKAFALPPAVHNKVRSKSKFVLSVPLEDEGSVELSTHKNLSSVPISSSTAAAVDTSNFLSLDLDPSFLSVGLSFASSSSSTSAIVEPVAINLLSYQHKTSSEGEGTPTTSSFSSSSSSSFSHRVSSQFHVVPVSRPVIPIPSPNFDAPLVLVFTPQEEILVKMAESAASMLAEVCDLCVFLFISFVV